MLQGVLGFITGAPGSGKSYMAVHWLVREIFPYYPDRKVLSNIPLFVYTERCTLAEFPRGWLPPGDDQGEQLEYLRDTIVIIDEFQNVVDDKVHQQALQDLFSLSRKYGCQWVLMTQTKENFPKSYDDMCEVWVECKNARALRDPNFGFRIGDWLEIKAKLTGKFTEYFEFTEYVKKNRYWRPENKVPFRTYFEQEIGDAYDTKSGKSSNEDGSAKVVHDYQRFGLVKLCCLVAMRNAHCLPLFFAKNAAAFGPLGLGLAGLWWFSSSSPKPVAVVTPAARAAAAGPLPGTEAAAAAAKLDPLTTRATPTTRGKAVKRVLTWLLLLCGLMGCVTEKQKGLVTELPQHVGRAVTELVEPNVAAFGGGHSLDGLLASAGVHAETGLEVDGPLVGREVIAAAQGAGYAVKDGRAVPARKMALAVPQELGEVEGATKVGGFQVKIVDDAERERWQELGAVVFEAYSTELLICAVSSSVSKELTAVVSGTGNLTVSQPVQALPFVGKATVNLALNGSVVTGRQIARPVLTSAPGASARVHVGQRIPVRLTTSSVSGAGGTSTTVGSSIQYVQTGTQVELAPTRINSTQMRLVGSVTVSEQTATVDNVPSTSERSLTVDHLVKLDTWTVLGRLDAGAVKGSRGWLALGGLRQTSDESFVVLGRVVQVHAVAPPERRHESAKTEKPVEKPVEKPMDKPAVKASPDKPKEGAKS